MASSIYPDSINGNNGSYFDDYLSQKKDRKKPQYELIRLSPVSVQTVGCTTPSPVPFSGLDFAREMNEYVRSVIFFSSNNTKLSERSIKSFSGYSKREAFDRVYSINKVVERIRASSFQVDPFEEVSYVYKLGSLAEKHNVGNCFEMGAVGIRYAAREKADHRIELFVIENGDHVFLVGKRREGSDVTDPTTWGEEAYICDSWLNEVYPVSEISQKLKDCKACQFTEQNLIVPKLTDYDPRKHKFESIVEYKPDRDLKEF